MAKFLTQYSESKRFFMPKCKKTCDEYIITNINGCDELTKTGNKIPWYDQIQGYKDECDINITIDKIANGDTSVIEEFRKRQAVQSFIDISDLSDNILDNFNRVEKFKNNFDLLPPDVKSKFDNNYKKFISMVGSDPNILNDLFNFNSIKEKESNIEKSELKENKDESTT